MTLSSPGVGNLGSESSTTGSSCAIEIPVGYGDGSGRGAAYGITSVEEINILVMELKMNSKPVVHSVGVAIGIQISQSGSLKNIQTERNAIANLFQIFSMEKIPTNNK